MAVAIVAFLRFDEPRPHRAADPIKLRSHVALTFRTMTRQPDLRRVILLAATVALLSQTVFEFGPLWLVALKAPATLFGPYWAVLVATLGAGGYLASKLDLDRRALVIVLALVGPAAALVLWQTRWLAVVIGAQAALALCLAIIGIHAGRLLHDGVPSAIRAGVSSGVGTFSWMLFLPFSLVFGAYARQHGVQQSGSLLTAAALLVGVLLVASAAWRRPEPAALPAPGELACRDLVELVSDYLDGLLAPSVRDEFQTHLAGCDGCTEYVRQIGITLRALKDKDLALTPKAGITVDASPQRG
jgi:hypothetical protein